MGSTTATYKFVAAAGVQAPPVSGTAAERARTVLANWAGEAPGRRYEAREDRAVYLLARVQHDDAEGAAARERLFAMLAGQGLKSAVLPCGID